MYLEHTAKRQLEAGSMNSLWKDLVYVHSHLLWREDLLWQDQSGTEPVRRASHACTRARRFDRSTGTGSKSPEKKATHWPRLAAPR
jgi:hypothetical protein